MPSEHALRAPVAPLPDSLEILVQIFEFAPDAQLLVDTAGRILKANALAETMFGYRREELLGQLVEILIPERFTNRHVGYRDGYMTAPRLRPMGAGVELFARRKNGSELPVDIMLSPLDTAHGRLALVVVRDITDRKRAEELARREREMHFKELHHRVKNNLQVISSLLFLQSTYTTDPETLQILKESQSRVKSIAIIHEKLYRYPERAKIDFTDYVRDLVGDLVRAYSSNQTAYGVAVQIDNIAFEIDTAMPCGLIINELVSNVFKHAFPDYKHGQVRINLAASQDNDYCLTVQDNGVGLPRNYDWQQSTSLGLKLVMDLAQQLDGHVEVEVNNGTTFRIFFNEVHYKERS